MKFYIYVAAVIFLLFCAIPAVAQLSNKRCKWVKYAESAFELDTLSLLPDSVRVAAVVPSSAGNFSLRYDLNTNKIQIIKSRESSTPDSLLICYRVFPYLFTRTYFHRDQAAYDSGLYTKKNYVFIQPLQENREELFPSDRLNKNGSISRGISFGNRQDMFVNSALNLQLDGQLSDDIHLTAVLSDQNVPFQPEGNTQRIQEFDRVFVKISHKLALLHAGDIVLQNRPGSNTSQFLRYYKNVSGALLETNYGLKPDSTRKGQHVAVTQAGIGGAKGRFSSQQIPVAEGVQGPYRLRGAENERFIVILANSERVFLDGKPLLRGFNYDYVIDYNTAEITFTNNVVITRFSRVRIDFEYSVQNYSRSIVTVNHHQRIGRFGFFGNYYREADNPNRPILQELDSTSRRALHNAGDSLNLAYVSSARPIKEFTPDQIAYERVDTLIYGRPYHYFVRSTKADTLWAITFIEVPFGQGDYVQGSPTANGREYRWTGIGQGNFVPQRLILAPNERRMITGGANFQLSKADQVYGEVAMSTYDVNMLSDRNSQDDNGRAFKAGYLNTGKNIPFLKGYQWSAAVDYEFDDANFKPIDRFRYIEFDRDWGVQNYTQTLPPANDHIMNAAVGIEKNASNLLHLRYSRRKRGDLVNGFQQQMTLAKSFDKVYVISNGFLMKNTQRDSYTDWMRFSGEIFFKNNYIIPGYIYSTDRNTIRSSMEKDAVIKKGSVIGTAMNFEENRFYVRSGDSSKVEFRTDFARRTDNDTLRGELRPLSRANTMNLLLKRQTETQYLNVQFTYRELKYMNDSLNRNEETVMGRLDWNAQFFKNVLRSEITMVNATGRELRREFNFVRVDNGQGTHTWRDDNADNVPQLNEFYLAVNPDEKQYVKFFIPTDKYIQAYSNNFNYRLNINAPRNWATAKGFKLLLSKFSSVSSWTINRKITDPRFLPRFVPFINVGNTELQSTQEILRTTVFFNRTSPQYGADFSLLSSEQKQLLTGGFETRKTREGQFNLRSNIGKKFNARLNLVSDLRGNASDFMTNRNYSIAGRQVRPEVSFQPTTKFRLTAGYVFQHKRNVFEKTSTERALFNELNLDLRLSEINKRTISARMRYVNIGYTGATNTPVGYEMMEALQRGTNFTWTLNWQQRLSNGLQLTIQYDGRKSEGQQVVHVGRMQVSALF